VLGYGWAVHCVVNPELGHEYQKAVAPAPTAKRIAVVGAGPAGIQYAITAASRGHRVTLLDKAPRIGGQVNLAAVPSYKKPELSQLLDYYKLSLSKQEVDVRLNAAGTADEIAGLDPDLVVLATGSHPCPLRVPGGERAKTAVDVLQSGGEGLGRRVCIVGGDGVGCDVALFLKEKGKDVTILEMRDDIALDLVFQFRWHLRDMLRDQGIKVLTGHRVTGVSANGVTASAGSQNVDIPCDDVVSAVGFIPAPAAELEQELVARGIPVESVGSSVAGHGLYASTSSAFWAAVEV
jgi:NADPH-dependent 2,4-dienoyl-CoA reductase/sulfur reductase-like enzyme